MMLLALISPVLAIGVVMVLEVFETWTLGGQNGQRSQGQPSRRLQSPQKGQAPIGSPGLGSPVGLIRGSHWTSPSTSN
jgi:hypothetical protein